MSEKTTWTGEEPPTPVLYFIRQNIHFADTMQPHSVFLTVQNLAKPRITTGGLCFVLFARHQDIQTFNNLDPLSGGISQDLLFKPGTAFYTLQAIEKGRIFKERKEQSSAGPFIYSEVTGTIPGSNANHITAITAMQFPEFVVLVKERNGDMRIMGYNPDCGAQFDWDYTSNDNSDVGKRNVKFFYESHLPIPLYQGGNIILDDTIIPIVPGGSGGAGTPGGGGSLALHIRFKVGKPGSPLMPGATIYQHADLANKNVMVFSNGIQVPQYADEWQRYCAKEKGSVQLNFSGPLMDGEIIEIFIY